MALENLADDDGLIDPEPFAGPDHPMRVVTREAAFEAGWSPGRARRIAELFDGLADGWAATHGDPVRLAPVRDGLRRGDVDLGGRWLELGSGSGAGTRVLAAALAGADADGDGRRARRWAVAVDLSPEMLVRAPGDLAPRVRADASRLPFPGGRFDGVLLVNMLLFPSELDRVLADGGRLLWVNTLGDQTPIHLPPADVLAALPGQWSGRTARSGSGFWLAARRDR